MRKIQYNLDFDTIFEGKESEVLDKIRKYIVYYIQILAYLSILIDELHSSIQFKDIGNQTSISKDQGYPRFQNLEKIYTKFQEQVFILDIRENVFRKHYNFIINNDIKKEYDLEAWEGYFLLYTDKLDIYEKQDETIVSFESDAYNYGVTLLTVLKLLVVI